MFNTLKLLYKGTWQGHKSGLSWPLVRWFSGSESALMECSVLNRNMFVITEEMKYGWLSLIAPTAGRIPKYLKVKKPEEDKKVELVKPYIKKIYKWGEQEWNSNLNVILPLVEDKEYLEQLNKIVGFDKKECHRLKLEYKTFKVDLKKTKVKSLWEF